MLLTALRGMRARKAMRADAAERAAIARAFNDRYTYRKLLVEGMPTLPGSFYGMPHQAGYAWMCPDCNRIHHPIADSVFSGLQYPACCAHPVGHRLHQGIRTQ
ncbi:MAG TPA: hypothetical protein VEB23_08285 [Ramlibacter sp.]|nr:hypothetical protein [Ramlibacter sp.]